MNHPEDQNEKIIDFLKDFRQKSGKPIKEVNIFSSDDIWTGKFFLLMEIYWCMHTFYSLALDMSLTKHNFTILFILIVQHNLYFHKTMGLQKNIELNWTFFKIRIVIFWKTDEIYLRFDHSISMLFNLINNKHHLFYVQIKDLIKKLGSGSDHAGFRHISVFWGQKWLGLSLF